MKVSQDADPRLKEWIQCIHRPAVGPDDEGVTCQACAGVHFVNRKGKVLGGDGE